MMEQQKNTIGGAAVTGDVSSAQDFVGRDKIGAQVYLSNLDRVARWLGVGLILAVLAWSAISALASLRLQGEANRLNARKPFLERQLALYSEAVQVTSVLATSTDIKEKADAEKRFWQLYWGELAMVENTEVEGAMIAFGKCLKVQGKECKVLDKATNKEKATTLTTLAIHLACVTRNSLTVSWGIEDLGLSASCTVRE